MVPPHACCHASQWVESVIVVVLVLLLVAVAARWRFGSWLAPAACVAGFWTVALALPMLLAPDFGYSWTAVVSLALGAAVFAGGAALALPGPPAAAVPTCPTGDSVVGARTLVALSCLGTTAGLAATAVTVAGGGYSPGHLLSAGGLLEIGNAISVQRYGSSEPTGPLTPLLLTLVYAAALAAPFVRLLGLRARLVRFGPVAAAGVFSLISTERLVLLTAVVLAVGAEAMTVALRGGSLGRLGVRLAALAVAVGTFFSLVAFVRVGSFATAQGSAVMSNLRSYAFGYLAGYSQWFDDYLGLRNGVPTDEPTFFAPLDLLWPDVHIIGTSRGYVDGRTFGADGGTNIFTAARALVVELGLHGALVFLVAAGFVTTRWYRALRLGRGHRSAPWSAAFLATVLLSPTQSFFTFTNTTAAVFVGALVVNVCVRPAQLDGVGGDDAGTEAGEVRKRALSAPLPRN